MQDNVIFGEEINQYIFKLVAFEYGMLHTQLYSGSSFSYNILFMELCPDCDEGVVHWEIEFEAERF